MGRTITDRDLISSGNVVFVVIVIIHKISRRGLFCS